VDGTTSIATRPRQHRCTMWYSGISPLYIVAGFISWSVRATLGGGAGGGNGGGGGGGGGGSGGDGGASRMSTRLRSIDEIKGAVESSRKHENGRAARICESLRMTDGHCFLRRRYKGRR
ncbi:unnamed protein product, partial [Ectocarpus sp. 12 AP-2014]